jgi:PHD/YefM family antitoxin component YafN of YafNO toxin-antitoxin module
MRTISYEALRRHLSAVFNGVAEEGRTVAVRWKGKKVGMISEAEWSRLLDTIHLLSSPRKSQRVGGASALAFASRQRRKNSSSGHR